MKRDARKNKQTLHYSSSIITVTNKRMCKLGVAKRYTVIVTTSTHLLSKGDPTGSDQNDSAAQVDALIPQQPEVIFLPVICIQDSTLDPKKEGV